MKIYIKIGFILPLIYILFYISLLILRNLLPQLDGCSGLLFCFGPISSALIISSLPGILLAGSIGNNIGVNGSAQAIAGYAPIIINVIILFLVGYLFDKVKERKRNNLPRQS